MFLIFIIVFYNNLTFLFQFCSKKEDHQLKDEIQQINTKTDKMKNQKIKEEKQFGGSRIAHRNK